MKHFQLNQYLIYFLSSFLLFSCGASDEEKVEVAIERAKRFLSTNDCTKALEVLNEVGYQSKNVSFLSVYSASYACKAGFNEPTFFGTDLTKLGTVSQVGLFGALSTFSTSNMTSPTSTSFTALQTAIDTLLYSGELVESSHANRLTVFTGGEASNLGIQALYMIMAQMGQFLKYYGDADSAGVKAGGSATNTCIIEYPVANTFAIAAITGAAETGACTNAANSGHASMEANATAAQRKTRMCHFVVLFNNFVDIIANVSFTGGQTGALGDMTAIFDALCSGDSNGTPSVICGLQTQSVCEDATTTSLEIFMAAIVERNFK